MYNYILYHLEYLLPKIQKILFGVPPPPWIYNAVWSCFSPNSKYCLAFKILFGVPSPEFKMLFGIHNAVWSSLQIQNPVWTLLCHQILGKPATAVYVSRSQNTVASHLPGSALSLSLCILLCPPHPSFYGCPELWEFSKFANLQLSSACYAPSSRIQVEIEHNMLWTCTCSTLYCICYMYMYRNKYVCV